MQQWLASTLTGIPLLTLFVVIGLGYVVGQINLFGFRFGVAAVLFMGLAVGSLSPSIALPEIVPSLGLIIFVYTIGIQSGPSFFASFRREGYRNSLLAVGVLLLGAALTLAFAYPLRLPAERAAGLFTGALTNTAALAAVRERVRERGHQQNLQPQQIQWRADQPVVAFSIAYPIGVIGVLVCFELTRKLWRPRMQPREEAPEILVRDFAVTNPGVIGATAGDLLRLHRDAGFVISRIRHRGKTEIVTQETRLAHGDVVVVVGDEEAISRAQHIFGEPIKEHIEADRSKLDYRRVFVSSEEVVGKRIADLDLPHRLSATITRLRRGDVDIVPTPEARLEFGDRVRVLARRENFPAVSQFFGDSIKGTAETDFGSVAIGMVLGALVGLLAIPVPGGTIRLGLAGGPLLVALVLGKLERSGRICWVIPISANLTLRQIGLLLFLAGVGTNAGFAFAQAIRSGGVQMLLAGAAITFAVTLTTLIVCYKLLRIPFDSLMGLMSGLQTQPACLAFATNVTRSEAPNVAYASVYPIALIAKIILAQLLLSWAGGRTFVTD